HKGHGAPVLVLSAVMVMSAEENSCCRMIKPMRRRSLHIPRNPGPNGRKGVRGFPGNSSYLQLPCTEIAGDPQRFNRIDGAHSVPPTGADCPAVSDRPASLRVTRGLAAMRTGGDVEPRVEL